MGDLTKTEILTALNALNCYEKEVEKRAFNKTHSRRDRETITEIQDLRRKLSDDYVLGKQPEKDKS